MYVPRNQLGDRTSCIVETELVGGPLGVRFQMIMVVLMIMGFLMVLVVAAVVVASITAILNILHEFMLEMRSRLRWEKCTSAYGAGVFFVKPIGDAVRSDEVVARKANLALDDTGF